MVAAAVEQEAMKCLVLHDKELGQGDMSERGRRCGWLGGGRARRDT